MKRTGLKAIGLAIAALALGFVPLFAGKMDVQSLPPAVRATIEKEVGTGKILELEQEKEHGVTMYEVEFERDGKTSEIAVSEDGRVLGREDDDEKEAKESKTEEEEEASVPLDSLPPAVREAALKVAAGNPIDSVQPENEEKGQVYEVNYKLAGVPQAAEISPAGDVIELEQSVAPDALPKAMLDQIQKAHPGAVVRSAEVITLRFYEVVITKDGRRKELKMIATGKSLGDDDDEGEDDEDEDDEDEDDDED